MTYGIRLAAIVAVMATALAVASGVEAGNRKAFKSLKAEANAYCEEIKQNEVYECSVEKCPCAEGLREVKRFDKLRTRPACVCTPDQGRTKTNEADATDYCVDWNHSQATENDRCFVTAGQSCPDGTSELKGFNKLRDRGQEQTACRGLPPEEDDDEQTETEEEGAESGE